MHLCYYKSKYIMTNCVCKEPGKTGKNIQNEQGSSLIHLDVANTQIVPNTYEVFSQYFWINSKI